MLKTDTLKRHAPDFRANLFLTLLSVLMLCGPNTDAAIVDGDFETNVVAGNPATSPLTAWAPTNSPDGSGIILGIDPAFYNSVFTSLASTGGGTPGGSVSAVFTSGPGGGGPANQMASISQDVASTPGKFYDIRMWVANMSTTGPAGSTTPDLGARANLFSVMWNGTLIDLSAVDPVHFAAPNPSNPAAVELAGAAGTYVLTATGSWTLLVIPNLPTASTGTTTTLKISAQNNNLATAVDAVEVVPEPSSVVLIAAGATLAALRRRRQRQAA
jgi:hypothetical protein